MEQKSINDKPSNEQVRQLKLEMQALEDKKRRLQLELKSLQTSCTHDFIETAIMRKCQKCSWAESMYY